MVKYKTIVIDPPWKYGSWGVGSAKSVVKKKHNEKSMPLPYCYMSVDELKKMPVSGLMDTDCEVYIWVTQKYLPDVFDISKAWGLKYCQTLTWCKKPRGKGQGGVYCPTTEFLILFRKGKAPKVERIDTTWFEVKRQNKHSKKPDLFQDMIEKVSYSPRLEMFARRQREGWDVFGNEVLGSISI